MRFIVLIVFSVSVQWIGCLQHQKILLGVEQTDFVINGIEMGYNGYQFLCLLDRGYIYLPNIPTHLPNMVEGPQVSVDGVQYESFL